MLSHQIRQESFWWGCMTYWNKIKRPINLHIACHTFHRGCRWSKSGVHTRQRTNDIWEIFPDISILVSIDSLVGYVDCDAIVESRLLCIREVFKAEEIGLGACIIVVFKVWRYIAIAVNVGKYPSICVVGQEFPASERAKTKHIYSGAKCNGTHIDAFIEYIAFKRNDTFRKYNVG